MIILTLKCLNQLRIFWQVFSLVIKKEYVLAVLTPYVVNLLRGNNNQLIIRVIVTR